jgi:ADP-ribose pyrophosphatase
MRPWRTLARRTLLSRPPWLEVGEERVGLPDGREIDGFLWVRTRDFAAIVAITERDEVVLVRSYKHGPRTVSLAVPAGYIENAEEPLAAAKRELREETGYASEDWASLGSYVLDGNYGVGTAHIFLHAPLAR